MTDTDALRALLARVEAATEPDREINREIEHIVCGVPRPRSGFQMAYPSRYTESLDAAVALVRRLLPGTNVELDFTICAGSKFVGGTRMWLQEFGDDRLDAYADSGSKIWHPAQSNVACPLRALIARA